MFTFLQKIYARNPLVRRNLPAGHYSYDHQVDPEVSDAFYLSGEIELPETSLTGQLDILATTTNIQSFSISNEQFPLTEATTFLTPVNVNGRKFRKKMKSTSTRESHLNGFLRTSDFDDEWSYRDTHHFNSWLILIYCSNDAIGNPSHSI